MLKNSIIPIIVGPTAVGKTNIAIKLAKEFNYEIISADSRQIVREMSIGTAKPNKNELSEVKHHFIDIVDPQDDIYNSYIFGNEVRETMESLILDKKKSLIVGGSGLYIQSVADGFFDDLGIDDNLKLEYRKELEQKDINILFEELKKIDPEYANSIHSTNKQRIYRSLEVYHFTKKKITDLHKEHEEKKKNNPYPFFKPLYIGLNLDREILYKRINDRVLIMLKDGLVEEVQFLIKKYGKEIKRIQKTIGYKEVVDFLDGKLSEEEMINKIQQNSRRFAKRQITWFKRLNGIEWFDPINDYDKILSTIRHIDKPS